MSATALADGSIAEVGALMRSGRASPVDIVDECLDRIVRHDPDLHAFIEVRREEACQAARAAEADLARGVDRGPLHGIPYVVKDLMHVRGWRTTAGSRVLDDAPAVQDADVVARLREAGAILLGKSNLHELAFGPLGTNPHFGDTRNPWNTSRHAGGSSSGSAVAVASGMCVFAIGTDTTGSIRIPAAFCGVTGLKPTYDRVSRDGVVPLAWSMDHVGPLCRSAADARLVMDTICRDGYTHGGALVEPPVRGLRCAVLSDFTAPCAPGVAAAWADTVRALESLGLILHEASVPAAAATAGVAAAVLFPEALSCHRSIFAQHAASLAPDVRERFELAGLVSGADYVDGQRARRLLTEQVDGILAQAHVIACLTEPVEAPPLDAGMIDAGSGPEPKAAVVTRWTRLFNLTGHPAITVPCGMTAAQMPVGLQLAARHDDERTLLRIADAYQQITAWHRRTPDLVM